MTLPSVSIAIPTYRREQVLLDTIAALLPEPALELLVVDQTPRHEPRTEEQLGNWQERGLIRWLRLPQPSIPGAMNRALLEARGELVLYLDDDIRPQAGLVEAHAGAHGPELGAVVGQILQPGEQPAAIGQTRGEGIQRDLGFRFNAVDRVRPLANCMAGNLSVRRDAALRAGGFDENFLGAAYRFETEFCRRLARAGYATAFEPSASIHHLRAESGGTRSYGSHLTSGRGDHAVGDYYFAMRVGRRSERLVYPLRRFVRELASRFYVRRPWWLPVRLTGELRALVWALWLHRQGPRLLTAPPEGCS